MLISKFNLCKSEWLELVFDDRNKDYGAYELRQTYAKTMIKAMSIAFLSIALLLSASIILKQKVVEQRIIQITIPDPAHPPIIEHPKEVRPSIPKSLKTEAAKPVATIADPPPVVQQDQLAQKPIINAEAAKKEIGDINIEGPGSTGNTLKPETGMAESTGKSPGPDEVYTSGLDVMPSPIGGDAAWSKFLSKNIRFPGEAQSDGVSGRVLLSFIIEKDGSLSNIQVTRGAGHGFDEEALRVLKLAKAWKPGMQNGHAVRVKYSIPINFQTSE